MSLLLQIFYYSFQRIINHDKKNKVAVVTGASQGIGFAIATELASLGYSLGLIARTKADIEKVSRELTEKVSRCESY